MSRALTRLWTHHKALLLSFLAAGAVALFFAARLLYFTLYWADPDHRDQQIAGWMTPRYVAHSWNVPPEVIRDALMILPQDGQGRVSLEKLARETGVPLPELIDRVKAAIATHRGAGDG